MLFQSSIGIDIKKSSVAMVHLKGSFKGVKLGACKIHSLEKNSLLKEKLKIISELVKDFIKNNKITSSNIYLGIPREFAILKNIEFPLAVKENLRSTLTYEMDKYLPLPLDDIYFDCQIVNEDKENKRLNVLLVAAKKETISPYMEFSDLLREGISGIEISSSALTNYFSCDPVISAEKGYAFIFSNNGYLELGVVKNKCLVYSRSVKALENNEDIHSIIIEALKPFADVLKNNDGGVKLAFCTSDLNDDALNGFKAKKGFDAYQVELAGTGIKSMDLVTAYGLALKGLCKVPVQINILPDQLRKKLSKAGYYIMMALAGIAILTGLTWGGSRFMRQRFILNNLNVEIKRLVSEAENIDRIRTSSKEIEEKIDYFNTVLLGRVPFLEVLKELSRVIPETAWVQALTFSEKGLKLDGHAKSASELIPLLEDSPLFKDVAFLSTITKSGDGKEKFKIGLKISSQQE